MPRIPMPKLLATLAAALPLAAAPAPSGSVRAAEVIVQGDGTPGLVVDAWTCRRMGAGVDLDPMPGVEYEPGVTVDGEPVAPAEIGGGYDIDLPDEIVIPITVDLFGPWIDNTGAGHIDAETLVGTARVTLRDGTVYWNDRPMQPAAQRALREACRKLGITADAAADRKPRPPAE